MNATEKKYACKRLTEIAERLKVKAHTELTTTLDFPELTLRLFMTYLRHGKIKPIKEKLKGTITDLNLVEAFNIPKGLHNPFVRKYDYSKQRYTTNTDSTRWNIYCNKVDKKLQATLDEVMLGDSKKALKLIKSFETSLTLKKGN